MLFLFYMLDFKSNVMAKYNLIVNDATTFKEVALFIFDNKVKEGDEIVLDVDVSYKFDFLFRQVFFIVVRAGISNVLVEANGKGLPETNQKINEFWKHKDFSDALLEDTGVLVTEM